jgi:hypothetical protein
MVVVVEVRSEREGVGGGDGGIAEVHDGTPAFSGLDWLKLGSLWIRGALNKLPR